MAACPYQLNQSGAEGPYQPSQGVPACPYQMRESGAEGPSQGVAACPYQMRESGAEGPSQGVAACPYQLSQRGPISRARVATIDPCTSRHPGIAQIIFAGSAKGAMCRHDVAT